MNNLTPEMKKAYRDRYLAKIRSIEANGNIDPGAPQGLEPPPPELGSVDTSRLIDTLYRNGDSSWASEEVSFSQMPYGGTAADVRTKSGITAERLNAKLGGVFKGKGSMFITYGEKYGIDPSVLAAIAIHETGNGTSAAVVNKNNPGGMMQKNPKTGDWDILRTYPSLDAGVEALASNLKRNYIDQGLISIQQIQTKYAPVGATNDPTGLNGNWYKGVTAILNQFGTAEAQGSASSSYKPDTSKDLVVSDEAYQQFMKSLKFDGGYFLKNKKIQLPTESYSSYQAFAKELVERNGITNSAYFDNLFAGPRKNKFIDSRNGKATGAYLRKDFVYYLEILHARVSSTLGVKALTITSAYRDPDINKSSGGSSNSMHLGAIAVDISAGTYKNALIIADAAYYMNFGGIAIGKGNSYFVHLDIGPSRRHKYDKVPQYISPTEHGR